MFILGKMATALTQPRQELSSYAPRIEVIKINTEKIGGLIGPGGKTIKGIIDSNSEQRFYEGTRGEDRAPR